MSYPEDELAARRNRRSGGSRRTGIPSESEYEAREAQVFRRDVREAETAPLVDRKEAASEFFEAMRDRPGIVGERVGWLLDGNYGYGAMKAAERVVKSRGNRAAQLTHMIGALEWKCSLRGASAGWNKLTPEQKRALDHAVNRAIEDYEREHGGTPRNGSRNRRRGR